MKNSREGWAIDSARVAEMGNDELIWSEFLNVYPSLNSKTSMAPSVTPSIRHIVCNISKKDDRQLSFQFFILFSRFEYALKKSSYLKSPRDKKDDCEQQTNKRKSELQNRKTPLAMGNLSAENGIEKVCSAEADWDKFLEKNKSEFQPPFDSELFNAVEYFKEEPPKKTDC